MKWLNKLERKYGHLAIRGLMNYIVIFTGITFALMYTYPEIFEMLILKPSLVLDGEVWRLVTFIFIPPTPSIFFIILTLYFYTIIGTGLENVWGSFRFNAYYLVGVLGTIAVSFITGFEGTPLYLNLSLFLAFARVYPDFEIMLFMIVPVKARILSWIYWGMLVNAFLFNPLSGKLMAFVSLLNYFLFFGIDLFRQVKRGYKVMENRRNFQSKLTRNSQQPVHRCTICNVTELDDPEMEFRYCTKCEGEYEYCMDHLKNHEHIKK